MLTVSSAPLSEFAASSDPLGLLAYEDAGLAGGSFLAPAARKALAARALEEGFKGKAGETAAFSFSLGGKTRRVYLAGMGKRKDAGSEGVRRGAAGLYKAARKLHEALWIAPVEPASALAEGLLLGAYDFRRYLKPDEDLKLVKVRLVAAKPSDRARLASALERAAVFCDAVCFVRDLVNTAPSDKSPEEIARLAEDVAGEGVTLKVIDEKEAAALGMGSFLGVARGSTKPPRMLHLTYKPKAATKRRVALVGKGVTFDSGGLSLKTAQAMEGMKMDMAGAATVLGVFKALPRLKPKAEVHGIAPLAFNMPGPDAVKPGDVLRAMNGKTIEVLNTDAEGRLILADALAYAVGLKPDAIYDFATLTGAASVALGSSITGAMGNDKAALARMQTAAKKADEPIWELPLFKEYKENVKSKVADLQNIGKVRGEAGTIIGGIFLQEFVGDVPWVHFDFAGTAWTDSPLPYCPAGGTGALVRTTLEYLVSL